MTYLLDIREEAINSKIIVMEITNETNSTQYVTDSLDVACFHFGVGRSIR